MRMIIIGAGTIGGTLAAMASEAGHEVTLIEQDEGRADRAGRDLDCRILKADVASGGILEEADIEHSEALIATTGDDATNLMAVMLAKESEVENRISIVNDQRHVRMFEDLGARVLVDPEVLIARHLLGLLLQPGLKDVVPMEDGTQVSTVTLGKASPLAGRTLVEIGKESLMPKDTLIICLRRGKKVLIPRGDTTLAEGDVITLYSSHPLSSKESEIFGS